MQIGDVCTPISLRLFRLWGISWVTNDLNANRQVRLKALLNQFQAEEEND
jgi:hypothetical protein